MESSSHSNFYKLPYFFQHFIILLNVGLLTIANVKENDLRRGLPLQFVPAYAATNRCPKEQPYSFRNQKFCCSRPVHFEWNKDGYCYGRTKRCSHSEGCVNCKYIFVNCIPYAL